MSASSSSGRKLQGPSSSRTHPECFSVVYDRRDCAGSAVGPGNACDLDACSFNIAALDIGGASWTGKLSCEGGAALDLGGAPRCVGRAQKTAPGVAYNVRVLSGAWLGTVNIDLRRWVTRSESPDRCAAPGAGTTRVERDMARSLTMKNPFPGPQPYRASDRDRFYGRGDLAHRLEGSILANRCVTVFGPSGAGKSSLVQAAVSRRSSRSRRSAWRGSTAGPRIKTRRAGSRTRCTAPSASASGRPAPRPRTRCIAAAQRAARGSPRLVLVYLDQIEQLLYASRAATEAEAFFACVSRLAALPSRNLRLVLSLREDYLGRFRDRLREHHRLLDARLPRRPADGRRAVRGRVPGGRRGRAAAGVVAGGGAPARCSRCACPARPPSDEAEAQAAYAQIVCRALFQQRARGGAAASAVEAEPILQRYLEATLDGLGALRDAARRLLEDHLVTADGSRTLRTEKELLGSSPRASSGRRSRALEGAAILHAAEHQGSRYFEIGHDWLARKVFEQRQQRRARGGAPRQRAEAEAEARRGAGGGAASPPRPRRRVRRRGHRRGVARRRGVPPDAPRGPPARRARPRPGARPTGCGGSPRRSAPRRTTPASSRGFRVLAVRGQLAVAMKLLPEVGAAAMRAAGSSWRATRSPTNALRVTLRGHTGPLAAAAWAPTAARAPPPPPTARRACGAPTAPGEPVVLNGHGGPSSRPRGAADGARVLTGSEDGTARVWRADGAGRPVELKGHHGGVTRRCGRRAPTARASPTASDDGTARVWAPTARALPIVAHRPPRPPINAVAAPRRRARRHRLGRPTGASGRRARRAGPLVLGGHTARWSPWP